MFQKYLYFLPPEAPRVVLVLFLSFLVGLEREELKRGGRRMFGGVRTFPLLGLVGYAVAMVSGGNVLAMVLGFFVVGAFMLMSYWHKLRYSSEAGITTEVSGLLVYLVGLLVHLDRIWFACTLVVFCLLLLELKEVLEGLTEHIAPEEVTAFTKFMLLTWVVLPLVPNQEMGPFHINPFKTWLVVVAVCGVSYGSYLLQRASRGRRGVFLTAILGGIYSSTVATVVLSKRAGAARRPHAYSGSILTASGMMYLRIVALVWIFNRHLAWRLAPGFIALALVAAGAGWIWSRRPDSEAGDAPEAPLAHNPLELRAAFFFAAVFLGVLVVTRLAVTYLGNRGVYTLAGIMGVTDVDPFIMGMTNSSAALDANGMPLTPMHVAAAGIVLATASNNLVKACYGWFFADRSTGRMIFAFLAGLALLGLVPLFWV